jgi:hypothetical protein
MFYERKSVMYRQNVHHGQKGISNLLIFLGLLGTCVGLEISQGEPHWLLGLGVCILVIGIFSSKELG